MFHIHSFLCLESVCNTVTLLTIRYNTIREFKSLWKKVEKNRTREKKLRRMGQGLSLWKKWEGGEEKFLSTFYEKNILASLNIQICCKEFEKLSYWLNMNGNDWLKQTKSDLSTLLVSLNNWHSLTDLLKKSDWLREILKKIKW